MHSRGVSYDDASDNGGGRLVGTREWARYQEESSSTLIGGASVDTVSKIWTGPGRDLSREHRGHRRGSKRESESGGGGHVDFSEYDDEDSDPDEHFGGYPLTQEVSMRSGLSHDLSGFSEFETSMRHLDDPATFEARQELHGAAAAAYEADLTNQAAAKQRRSARFAGEAVPGASGRTKSRRAYPDMEAGGKYDDSVAASKSGHSAKAGSSKPPGPTDSPAVKDTSGYGEMKDEGISSLSRIDRGDPQVSDSILS